MTTRMLIDARHREETRVAVVKGNRIEEFDFESAEHKQLKGNIYLAKVTRVEPSLQAAFVDYGGNRHGFLAFAEIHPDYYQIPKEDRDRLLREEAEHAAEEAALRAEEDDEAVEGDVEEVEPVDHGDEMDADVDAGEEAADAAGDEDASGGGRKGRRGKRRQPESEADELRRKRMALRRRYKIQDVIHRRQVLLVQVVKEERGNKGAALTTYLSLAGRYCVLMPNTSHGGGISRKISNAADRKRLKSIIADMNLPSTMGCIVRTAGLQRTKPEIKRDFDYLARLWDEIREKTLKSAAPALIHNDSDLIKRAIRDIYNKDIDEVIVEGADGYRAAKDFMKLLMPSHAKKVGAYADAVSLFQRYGVEDQLAAMYHPVVQLKSGGYLVINPTEALVSIDINSGRSTREHGIEQTAVATNLEAAREIARQLRLRDMAGLVVIDFIDMEVNSNIRKVEKAMKEALKDDRARIQLGRISGFGLMEMSRQRLRTGVLEASTRECPHCEGTGLVRTASSAGLSALRLLEEEAARGRGTLITLRASQEAAFYVLNNKRRELDEIESRYGVRIAILPDGETEGARMSVESSGPRPAQAVTFAPIVDADEDADIPDEEEDVEEADANARGDDRGEEREGSGRRRRRRRRGRRGRREEGGEDEGREDSASDGAETAEGDETVEMQAEDAADEDAGGERRRSRRGRRGGRRRRGEGEANGDAVSEALSAEEVGADAEAGTAMEPAVAEPNTEAKPDADVEVETAALPAEQPAEAEIAEEAPAPKPRRSRARKKVAETEATEDEAAPAQPAEEAPAPKPRRGRKAAVAPAEGAADAAAEQKPESEAKPKRASRSRKAATPPSEAPVAEASGPEVEAADGNIALPEAAAPAASGTVAAPEAQAPLEATAEEPAEEGEPRRGWWQRTFGG